MHRTFLAVLGTAALAVAGCGGDDDKESGSTGSTGDTQQETAKPLTKAEYIAQADDICREGKKATDGLEKRFDALGDDPDVKEIAPVLEDVVAQLRKTREQLGALPAPSEDKATLDGYFASADKTIDVAEQLQEAAEDGDESKADNIADSNDANNDEGERLGKQYGFKVCAS